MQATPALITLRDGRTYAASDHRVEKGHVRAMCRRFVKVGQQGQEWTSFHGPLQERSWPRDAVKLVRVVEPSAGLPEGATAAPVAS